MRDSLVFYRSFADAIRCLDKESQLEALWNIIDYALDEKEPTETNAAMAVYLMAKPQVDKNNSRYQNGTKGGREKTKAEPNDNQTITKPEPNVNDNDNENVNENVNENENALKEKGAKAPEKKRFVPPTVAEVEDYCHTHDKQVDAQAFVDYYTSNGWMVGRNKMKSWQAAVGTWDRKRAREPTYRSEAERIANRVKVVDDWI